MSGWSFEFVRFWAPKPAKTGKSRAKKKHCLLLSQWLQKQNKPISKRNFYTAEQRLLAKCLSNKTQEDELIKALTRLSNYEFKSAMKKRIWPSQDLGIKEQHRLLKAAMKLSQPAPTLEGIIDVDGQIIVEQTEVQEMLHKFFRQK